MNTTIQHRGSSIQRLILILLISALRIPLGAAEDRVVPRAAVTTFPLVDFEGTELPANGDGLANTFPDELTGYAGQGATAIDTTDAAVGRQCCKLTLTTGTAYPSFQAWDYLGVMPGVDLKPRGFIREYGDNPVGWQFNTYNRLRFWVKCPSAASALKPAGGHNIEFGTYVKTVSSPDRYSDETGGGHYYHFLNVPNTDTWTQVVLNMHPSHERGADPNYDWGVLAHPTGEGDYNYFDALSRFYMEFDPYLGTLPNNPYPLVYKFDGFEFYQEGNTENDDQVYSVAGTYVPAQHRVVVTWSRNKYEETINHEVRYSFQDIHQSGWDAATPAPDGLITPSSGYFGMTYDSTGVPIGSQSTLFIAIKPQNSNLFTQIAIPLGGNSGGNLPPVFTSAASATPNPAVTGEVISFDGAALDPEGAALTYTWDFGDGSGVSGNPAAHNYSNPGDFTATLTVSDGQFSVQSSVKVTVAPAASNAMTLTKLLGKTYFTTRGKDTCSVAGTLQNLPTGLALKGTQVTLDVGGANVSFVLNQYGAASLTTGSFKLVFTSGGASFTGALKRGTWASTWSNYGVANSTVTSTPITMPVTVTVNGKVYKINQRSTYSAIANSTGTFKYP